MILTERYTSSIRSFNDCYTEFKLDEKLLVNLSVVKFDSRSRNIARIERGLQRNVTVDRLIFDDP